MSVTIYAYRNLLWLNQQVREVIPVAAVPHQVMPPDEEEFARAEMDKLGWLRPGEKTLGGYPDWSLSTEGSRQARRSTAKYPVYSAAYEILHAIPRERFGSLPGAEDAFEDSFRDPVLERAFTEDEIHAAAKLLHQQGHIKAEESHGAGLLRLEITASGEDEREEHYVPGLRVGSSPAETASNTEHHVPGLRGDSSPAERTFNTHINISGGTFGAAQFGANNSAHVENVGSEIHQHFQELRELAHSAPVSESEREEVLGQITQLEEVAKSGNAADFETLKNNLLGGFASRLGHEAALKLLALSPLISGLGNSF
ncbi:hypothetical protein [Nesterenkonia sandarakina]|uniref:Uncharacterized protein n=1 Tax=Nesterenkonia sandarakina TaxID=272918 RepID=A0A2T0YAP7_9MICC|nr:hypothetical protein [Nesterenkonia sandarakina]PRZ11776.1 hypothetical protein BCL67_1317 [Nesterenkonia sandarakina]